MATYTIKVDRDGKAVTIDGHAAFPTRDSAESALSELQGHFLSGDWNSAYIVKDTAMANSITDQQISELRGEAAGAGDTGMVAICDRALDDDSSAREECADAINYKA